MLRGETVRAETGWKGSSRTGFSGQSKRRRVISLQIDPKEPAVVKPTAIFGCFVAIALCVPRPASGADRVPCIDLTARVLMQVCMAHELNSARLDVTEAYDLASTKADVTHRKLLRES